MAMLRDLDLGLDVTPHVSLQSTSTPRLVVATALDGTTYYQSIGQPATTYSVTAFVQLDGKRQLEASWAACNLMEVRVRSGTYYGRISSIDFGKRLAHNWHEAKIVMTAEEVE